MKHNNHKIERNECKRCGTCCRKGGPSFHLEDQTLIVSGKILAQYLYTIRKGELARDNVKETLQPVSSDIIKIKGRETNQWTCVFLDEEKNCRIYATRPLECRVLKCWDTREIESVYAKTRLTREDLLGDVEGLLDFVNDHQSRCSPERLRKLADGYHRQRDDERRREILEMVSYDTHLRELVIQKVASTANMTDFLMGRPVTLIIRGMGLSVSGEGQHRQLCVTGSPPALV
jgi:Fe-S-cluster containining protein